MHGGLSTAAVHHAHTHSVFFTFTASRSPPLPQSFCLHTSDLHK